MSSRRCRSMTCLELSFTDIHLHRVYVRMYRAQGLCSFPLSGSKGEPECTEKQLTKRRGLLDRSAICSALLSWADS